MQTDMNRLDLTDPEVDAMCDGLTQNAAKVRYLQGLGLTVGTRPNGRPLVMREHAKQVLAGLPLAAAQAGAAAQQPRTGNSAALKQLFGAAA